MKTNVPKSNQQCISEQEMLYLSSECYMLLEKYKLKTNLVGINLPKDLIECNYNYLEERVIDRYEKMYEKLKEGINKLETNFRLAQGNALRTLNNIFRNYRRRVGTLANEPLSNYKYSKYEKQEKLLLQSIIYNEKENYYEIQSFKQQLEKNIENGCKEIEDKYRQNESIKENYNAIFDVIDKTQCYTFKYYENFERSMLSTINNLQTNFDKLNAFLSVWENVGSTKAYEVKSVKQAESEEKSHQNDRNRRYYEEETEDQLEELMKNCPHHSPQRQEYRKRLNELRRYNTEKQKKLDMVGKMYSKRRNRAGILVNKNKQISVLQWVINLDNSKIPYNYHDEFRNYRADNEHGDYRLTPYQSQRPMKNVEQIKDHMEKYRSAPTLNFQWWYDRFGKDGNFDLIASWSQQIQKRIEFEVVRQTELQNSDDRRKRELLQKQNYPMKENERKQCLHIGYLHIHDKTELEWLMQRNYNTQYIPGIQAASDSSDISFSDEQEINEDHKPLKPSNSATKSTEIKNKQQFPFVKIQKNPPEIQEKHEEEEVKEVQKQKQNIQIQTNVIDMPLQQQIIKIYFKEFSKKIVRKQSEPEYKKTEFLYFNSVAQIKWQALQKYLDYEKIFIYTQKSIFFFNKIFSKEQEKMKCNIYTVQQEDEEGEEERQRSIKQHIRACFKKFSLVTIKFHPIYLEDQSLTAFMVGLLVILMKEGTMTEDYQLKNYVNEGKQIIEDFNEYFFPKDNRSPRSMFMRKFQPHASPDVFAPVKKQDKGNQTQSIKSTVDNSLPPPSINPKSQNIKKEIIEEAPNIIEKNQPIEQKKEEVSAPLDFKRMTEQRELKRSNSRQFLNNYQMQIELNSLQQQYNRQDQQGDKDYQQL